MQTFLVISAPIIYIMVILFSIWMGMSSIRERRGINLRFIAAIFAGLITCPLCAVLIQLGQFEFPQRINIASPFVMATIAVGIIVGFLYVWIANIVMGNVATTSLFVMGSIGGSSVCLYFYFFHNQVNQILIGFSWGFLFGVLVYVVLKGGFQNTFSRHLR